MPSRNKRSRRFRERAAFAMQTMPQPTSARLLIVDGHAYAYRAFHAIQKLNAPDGSPTNAILPLATSESTHLRMSSICPKAQPKAKIS